MRDRSGLFSLEHSTALSGLVVFLRFEEGAE